MSYLSATYTYDQENRLSSTSGMSYTYDGNGERVLKSNTSTGAAVKRYWSMGGNTLAEGDGSGNLTAEYIYFGGKRVARIDLPANTVHYYLSDHLGSTSIVASAAGTVEEESDYYPFGTEVTVTGPGVNELKFTGKRRDTESQLDYFGARFYSNLLGRWMSPDWSAKEEPVPYAKLDNPQSLNLYSYVLNNPLSNRDEDGHEDAATKAAKVAAAAKTQDGSHAYDTNKTNVSNMQVFKPGSDKCNEFVADTVKSADGTRPVVDGTGKIPTAAQFADPNVKIAGLSTPEPLANAKPGDVIAQDHGPNPKTGNEEGHVGIVIAAPTANSPGQTASANANQGGKVTVNDWGFRSPTASPNNGERHGATSPAPVVRHPL
jgi:RHS repeat-associated protein